MYSVKQNGPAGTENAEKQCRLCLKQSREYYSLKKRFEDTPPVHEVIKTLLSFIEDEPELPQQICVSCSKELLYFSQVKDRWVANQFALARQFARGLPPRRKSRESQSSSITIRPCVVVLDKDMPSGADEESEKNESFDVSHEVVNEAEPDRDSGDDDLIEIPDDPEPEKERQPAQKTQQPPKPVDSGAYRRFIRSCVDLRCFVCTRGFGSSQSFQRHMHLEHSKMLPYRCTQCKGKQPVFYTVNSMNQHFGVHHVSFTNRRNKAGVRNFFTCGKCGQTFQSLADSKNHAKIHNRCKICGLGFTQRFSLKRHLQSHIRQRSSIVSTVPRYRASKGPADSAEGQTSPDEITPVSMVTMPLIMPDESMDVANLYPSVDLTEQQQQSDNIKMEPAFDPAGQQHDAPETEDYF
ncbi:zinc finger protein 628 [Culex quinquefasciatus]|uniref:zinc finger protein 628 n=1 Tax=Culex quinquefasciatus TaxID=7176 RepID=UPI0018E32697|nr:zinc finger protein 628 [Culex quinquefasciatus]